MREIEGLLLGLLPLREAAEFVNGEGMLFLCMRLHQNMGEIEASCHYGFSHCVSLQNSSLT